MGLVKMFSQTVGYHFILLTVSFAFQKIFSFMRSHLSIVDVRAWAIGILFSKLLPVPNQFKAIYLVYPVFHWGLLDLSFILLCADILLVQHHLLKILSFFPLYVFIFFDKNQLSIGVWFISGSSIPYLCTTTMQFLSLLLCNTAWGQGWWFPQKFFYLSGVF